MHTNVRVSLLNLECAPRLVSLNTRQLDTSSLSFVLVLKKSHADLHLRDSPGFYITILALA